MKKHLALAALLAAVASVAALAAGPDLDQGVDVKATLQRLRHSAKAGPRLKEREAEVKRARASRELVCKLNDKDEKRAEERGIMPWTSFTATLEGKSLTIASEDASGSAAYSGTLDPSYKPVKNKGMVRFNGFDGYLTDTSVSALMDKSMFSGRAGRIEIQGSGVTSTYRCKPRGREENEVVNDNFEHLPGQDQDDGSYSDEEFRTHFGAARH